MKWKGLYFEKQSIFISMLYLLLSFIIMGLSINLVAHANLGTSALTLIPLVLNELDPLSFGELTMIFNIILVISQIILLGKSFPLLMIQNLEMNAGEYVEDVMSVIDGLILIGGHDVSPLVYKQEPRKKLEL